jgi:4-amino-4-deoxychorismate lyase
VTVVAVLGAGVVPADTPILRADDLGALRGDGIFETLHVRGGHPWLLHEHLDRMAGSAAMLDLPLPARDELIALAAQACSAWDPAEEGALRLICTRGPEHSDAPTVYATLSAIGAKQLRGRRDGIAVRTLPLGFAAEGRFNVPGLLAGAKTLSYAINMACLRWAAANGADDVLWVSTEGYALEAPTATLVWLADGVLYTVPAGRTGILAGTTAAYLLKQAGELGWTAAEKMVRPAELQTAEGVWLTSSVRGAAEIRSLDGIPLGPSPEGARVRKILGYPSTSR